MTDTRTQCDNGGGAPATGPRLSGNAPLAASAFLLVALIIIAAARLGETPARADLVSGAGNITALTVQSSSEDVLLVIDNRSESISAYKVVNQNRLEHFRTYGLPKMFADARAQAFGRGR